MSSPRFSITLDPVGHSTVVVDGEDVSARVAGLSVQAAVGQPTTLTLHTLGGGVIEGEGIVQVQADDVADVGAIVAAFVAGIDAGELGREVNERQGWGTDPMVTALEVLAEWARGG